MRVSIVRLPYSVPQRRALIKRLDWGFSYGTVIGQYMVKILSPERIGKVIIDGVVNAGTWNLYADHFLDCEWQPHNMHEQLFTYSAQSLSTRTSTS